MGDFRYEAHLHTVEGSACGRSLAEEYARIYKEEGYDGIIVTDHFLNGNTTASRSASWEEKVNILCSGYEKAKRVGDQIGLKVFFGWEASYSGTDFLVYGMTKEWLLKHPEMVQCSIQEQYEIIHQAGGMVIQAHPFLEAPYILRVRQEPTFVDGVEVYNRSCDDRDRSYNDKAYEYAKEYKLPMTCGSDIHHITAPKVAMQFEEPLNSINDFIKVVLTGKGYEINR